MGQDLARQVKEALSRRGLTPVDRLVVLAEYQKSMGDVLTQASAEGEKWLKEQGLRADASLRLIRYIIKNSFQILKVIKCFLYYFQG